MPTMHSIAPPLFYPTNLSAFLKPTSPSIVSRSDVADDDLDRCFGCGTSSSPLVREELRLLVASVEEALESEFNDEGLEVVGASVDEDEDEGVCLCLYMRKGYLSN
jgi:hypothetical protein